MDPKKSNSGYRIPQVSRYENLREFHRKTCRSVNSLSRSKGLGDLPTFINKHSGGLGKCDAKKIARQLKRSSHWHETNNKFSRRHVTHAKAWKLMQRAKFSAIFKCLTSLLEDVLWLITDKDRLRVWCAKDRWSDALALIEAVCMAALLQIVDQIAFRVVLTLLPYR